MPDSKSEDPAVLDVALDGLREVARKQRGRMMTLQEINKESAIKSALAPVLMRYGFKDDYQGLVLMDTPR